MRHGLIALFCVLVLGCGASGASEPESSSPDAFARWDLALWLDAQALGAKRLGSRLSEFATVEVPLERWEDRSGHKRHFLQADAALQPRLIRLHGTFLVHFNGHGQHLRCTTSGLKLQEGTLFLVVRPSSNLGGFRAFFAANAPGGRDYQTGFTVDLGPAASTQLQWINVEGRGFSGIGNLLAEPQPLGQLHLLEITFSAAQSRVELRLDGKVQRHRPWQPGVIDAQEMTLGARYYTNGPGPQQVRGFLAGSVAEVMLFARELSPQQRQQVRRYLLEKYAPLRQALQEQQAKSQEHLLGQKPTVPNPPQVQMLVPGFDVFALPVRLPNINNVRYRPDGTLVALGYNGNIYLLRDRNGDGLEEHVELFWDNRGRLINPVGMALTPPGYRLGQGVFVASRGKVSLIVDTNGDDRADREVIVATGWQPLTHGVDALGVALDQQGNIYFGLGTANFGNPYLLDQQGRSHYRLDSPRGTIQKVSPDFRHRKTVCTGVRFTVGMAVNRYGELFCTDQEGATWLPNGNPFDELLWIRPGRHYGFPPRHPRYLPQVVDEPSVYDYGPQHQSTCGLFFNEPGPGKKIFGPSWWEDNVFVCGESRGKLFRTILARNPYGYVASTHRLACLTGLCVDACLSPQGNVVVSVHSGLPDWGTGPRGQGRLYKIVPTPAQVPRPVLAYAAEPNQVRVVFDRPLSSEVVAKIRRQVRITYGRYVRAGERYEILVPPYEVVQHQLLSPRYRLPVQRVELSPDGHSLIVHTARMHQGVWYAVSLPDFTSWKPRPGSLPQDRTIDVDFQLTGVEYEVATAQGAVKHRGWLPHLDLAQAQALIRGSPEHQALWRNLPQGIWTLKTQLRLDYMLRPRLQHGSRLDYVPKPEVVTLYLEANCPVELTVGRQGAQVQHARRGNRWWAQMRIANPGGKLWPVLVRLHATAVRPELTVGFFTAQDSRLRPLAPQRLILPWVVSLGEDSSQLISQTRRRLQGASWGRGRQVFFGSKAGCSRCHRIRGQGGRIGPDLSNLIHRDYESVRRDILQPSFTINPDFVSFSILLEDGRVLVGPVRSEKGQLIVGTPQGEEIRLDPQQVEQMQPTPLSVMPQDIGKRLSRQELEDLLAFLLLPPPRMPLQPRPAPPSARSWKEVARVVPPSQPVPPQPEEKPRLLRIVLVCGPKDHGPNEHDYPVWQRVWTELLRAAPGVEVIRRRPWPKEEDYRRADVIVYYKRLQFRPEEGKLMDRLLSRDRGLVFVHWAVDGHQHPEQLAQRIGLAAGPGLRFRHGPIRLRILQQHPITHGLKLLNLVDETYWNLHGDPERIQVLAASEEQGKLRPQVWTVEHRPGRVFVCIPGHYSWTFDDPLYRLLLLRGIAWAAGADPHRLDHLAWPGARVQGTVP